MSALRECGQLSAILSATAYALHSIAQLCELAQCRCTWVQSVMMYLSLGQHVLEQLHQLGWQAVGVQGELVHCCLLGGHQAAEQAQGQCHLHVACSFEPSCYACMLLTARGLRSDQARLAYESCLQCYGHAVLLICAEVQHTAGQCTTRCNKH